MDLLLHNHQTLLVDLEAVEVGMELQVHLEPQVTTLLQVLLKVPLEEIVLPHLMVMPLLVVEVEQLIQDLIHLVVLVDKVEMVLLMILQVQEWHMLVVEEVLVEVVVVLEEMVVEELVQLITLVQDLLIQVVAVVVLQTRLVETVVLMAEQVDPVLLLLEHQVQSRFQYHLVLIQQQHILVVIN